MTPSKDITVLGAGIIGLTTALTLLRAGYNTTIITNDLPRATTSANAGAIWGPFLSTLDARLARWSYETLDVLVAQTASVDSGVEIQVGIAAQKGDYETPWWIAGFPGSTALEVDRPNGYNLAWRYTVPVVDMPRYLDWLYGQCLDLGASVQVRHISQIGELLPTPGHVILCGGLGMRELISDDALIGSRGQLVVVRNPGNIALFSVRGDGPDLTYILPEQDKVILGGTAEPGVDSLRPDPNTTRRIIMRCAKQYPALMTAEILDVRVGIRPCRDSVRLEHDYLNGTHVIYNYGHGGSGLSVSWGCATDVLRLLAGCGVQQATSSLK